jgi:hypothetical protein
MLSNLPRPFCLLSPACGYTVLQPANRSPSGPLPSSPAHLSAITRPLFSLVLAHNAVGHPRPTWVAMRESRVSTGSRVDDWHITILPTDPSHCHRNKIARSMLGMTALVFMALWQDWREGGYSQTPVVFGVGVTTFAYLLGCTVLMDKEVSATQSQTLHQRNPHHHIFKH